MLNVTVEKQQLEMLKSRGYKIEFVDQFMICIIDKSGNLVADLTYNPANNQVTVRSVKGFQGTYDGVVEIRASGEERDHVSISARMSENPFRTEHRPLN